MFGKNRLEKKLNALDGYCTLKDRVVYDRDVARYVYEHTSLMDRLFNTPKIVEASMLAHEILCGFIEEPDKPNWKFGDKDLYKQRKGEDK